MDIFMNNYPVKTVDCIEDVGFLQKKNTLMKNPWCSSIYLYLVVIPPRPLSGSWNYILAPVRAGVKI